MTTAEIEAVLGSEDLRNLLEVAEQSGAVKHAELAEVLEPLELDEMEREALQRAAQGMPLVDFLLSMRRTRARRVVTLPPRVDALEFANA